MNHMPNLTFSGLEKVAEAVRLCVNIERIDLSMNNIKDEVGTIISKFVQTQ